MQQEMWAGVVFIVAEMNDAADDSRANRVRRTSREAPQIATRTPWPRSRSTKPRKACAACPVDEGTVMPRLER
jgi:hypothetical protein